MLSRSKFCIPFIKFLPPSIHNLFNKSVKKAIFTKFANRKGGIIQSLSSFKHSSFGSSENSSSIIQGSYGCVIDETSKPFDLPESFHECPAACEDKQKASTPMKSCNSLGSRSLELEPGAWFWFWDEPLGGKHVLGFYSLSLSFWYQTILTADSNSLLWVGFKDRVEADLWASVIRWVSRRIAMLSASLISLGLASLNRRRMSGSGRASMNCSRAIYSPHSGQLWGILVGSISDWVVREWFLYFTLP